MSIFVDLFPGSTPCSFPFPFPAMFSISSRRSSNSQGVLRKQRRPASEQTVSVTQFELVQQHRPPLDTRTMSTSMESSIYFASTVDYDDDDGMDDFFSRRLARELDTVVKTPPENLVHRVCQSDIGHGSPADYFETMPTSPISMFAGHGGRPSMSSEHAPSSTATHSSAADSQHVKRHKSKLRKPNRNSNCASSLAFVASRVPARVLCCQFNALFSRSAPAVRVPRRGPLSIPLRTRVDVSARHLPPPYELEAPLDPGREQDFCRTVHRIRRLAKYRCRSECVESSRACPALPSATASFGSPATAKRHWSLDPGGRTAI
ncbi:hypothetical protein EXIGLDRAFT_493446 [Exidia glandulosa HHB12029]|uniref:Uncharacterized protein n=1 Tax=Exidia glandulosa HHB12029 TaxID=1314781 RepID=A0A166NB45_EXIGL|nr:hypothetical protein EXIGLDRAFT_493446 [Exidia glandulosa HHB12029]